MVGGGTQFSTLAMRQTGEFGGGSPAEGKRGCDSVYWLVSDGGGRDRPFFLSLTPLCPLSLPEGVSAALAALVASPGT